MTWLEVTVEVPPSQAEMTASVLLQHCPQGFAETPVRGRRRFQRVYIAAKPAGRRTTARLVEDLRRVAPSARVRMLAVADDAWRDAWKRHARPVRIGRLTVLPTWWRDARRGGRVTVRLDAGMAFGSGEHPTTHLCLAALVRKVGPGTVVIDVGTGSGILAIAAARLGAGHVLAIDNDPVAVAVARQNVRANRVAGQVTVRLADTLSRVRLTADLIVANLTAQTLLPVVAGAQRRLRPGGRLVASGFGSVKVRDVSRAMIAAGLRPIEVERRRGWCAVHAVRDGRSR